MIPASKLHYFLQILSELLVIDYFLTIIRQCDNIFIFFIKLMLLKGCRRGVLRVYPVYFLRYIH